VWEEEVGVGEGPEVGPIEIPKGHQSTFFRMSLSRKTPLNTRGGWGS